MNKKEKIILATLSLLAGFCLMTIEIVSSRVVAPIVGNSIYSWTSLIGIVLLGLSLGSFVGGKIADKYLDKYLSWQFMLSSVFTLLIIFLSRKIDWLTQLDSSILNINLLASIFLFLLPSFFLGTIQPVILKKYSQKYSEIGSEYGFLSALWSVGSILGVFITGYYLISLIGSDKIIYSISIILAFISLLIAKNRKHSILLIIIIILLTYFLNISKKEYGIFNKETSYYKVKIVDTDLLHYGQSRILFLDMGSHSIEPERNSSDIYTSIHPLFWSINKNSIKDILFLGAGAYTLPKNTYSYKPDLNIDVVEIDEEMEGIANKYFNLSKYKINTIVLDARVYINNTEKKYDVVFGDAFNSFISVPGHLTTLEFNEKIKGALNKDGIYCINFIASTDGVGKGLFEAVTSTFKETFPNSFMLTFGNSPDSVQNIVLIGVNSETMPNIEDIKKTLGENDAEYLVARVHSFEKAPESRLITDSFFSNERLMSPMIRDYFPRYVSFLQSIR